VSHHIRTAQGMLTDGRCHSPVQELSRRGLFCAVLISLGYGQLQAFQHSQSQRDIARQLYPTVIGHLCMTFAIYLDYKLLCPPDIFY